MIKRCRVCGPEAAPGVTFFKMPSSMTMFEKWQEIVYNCVNIKLCKKDFLCENHFLREEIVCRGTPGQNLRLELNCNAYPANFARFETGHNFDSENTEKVKVVMVEHDAVVASEIMNSGHPYPRHLGTIELKEEIDRQIFSELQNRVVPRREGEFVKLEDGYQINEFGITRRINAAESLPPDPYEELEEEEPLTFETLKNSMGKDGYQINEFGITRRINAAESLPPDPYEELEEEEPLTFETLKNSMGKDGYQINEFGITRKINAAESLPPDPYEELEEEEPLTFEILKNSLAEVLPHGGWSYSEVEEDSVTFKKLQFSDNGSKWIEKKVIVERDLVMHAFILEKLLFFLPNLSSLSAVKSSLIEVDNVQICAGGIPDDPNEYRIFDNAYRDCSGKWRHTDCVLQVVDGNDYCDHCGQMNLLLMAGSVPEELAQQVEEEFNNM